MKKKIKKRAKYGMDSVLITILGAGLIMMGFIWIINPAGFKADFKLWQAVVFGAISVLGGLVNVVKVKKLVSSGEEEIIKEIKAWPILIAGLALILIGYSFIPNELKNVSAVIDMAGFLLLFLWILIAVIIKEKPAVENYSIYVERIIAIALIWLGCWITLLLAFEGVDFYEKRFDFITIKNLAQIFLPLVSGVFLLLMTRR